MGNVRQYKLELAKTEGERKMILRALHNSNPRRQRSTVLCSFRAGTPNACKRLALVGSSTCTIH